MRTMLAVTALGTMTAALVAAALLALWAVRAPPDTAQANHTVTVGLDMDPSGTPANTGTSLGSIEDCVDVTTGQLFDTDVYITNVGSHADQTLLAFSMPLGYDGSVIRVTAVDVLQIFGTVDVLNTSDSTLPDSDGLYEVGAAAIGSSLGSGSGVMAQVTWEAMAAGSSAVSIAEFDFNGDTFLDRGSFLQGSDIIPIGDTDLDSFFNGPVSGGTVAVDQPDSDGDGTSDICDPDSDNDTILDAVDNCPTDVNPGQADMDGDGFGDLCDNDIDGDGFPNADETAHGSDPSNFNSLIEVCDGLDNDADTLVDEDGLDHDNDGLVDDPGPDADGDTTVDCMDPDTDTDGDTIANPSDPDDDTAGSGGVDPFFNDRFIDTRENYIATDSLDACPDNRKDRAYPVDTNNDREVNVGDIIRYGPVILTSFGDPNYNRRFDINANGDINVGDIINFSSHILTDCVNPP